MSQYPQPYTLTQIQAWLRGLLTIAWADRDFNPEEQALIANLVRDRQSLAPLPPLLPQDLATGLGTDTQLAETFLRTAVMVAIADGIYSTAEDQLLRAYCAALGTNSAVLETLRLTLDGQETPTMITEDTTAGTTPAARDLLKPVRQWLDQIEIHSPQIAHFLCQSIPAQCPFERDIHLFRHKVIHIPPLCKLNPLYEQLVSLRFRALCYLADECGEDISAYC